MLQVLLKDRFSLKAHMEDRPISAYTLTAVNPKLNPADPLMRRDAKKVQARTETIQDRKPGAQQAGFMPKHEHGANWRRAAKNRIGLSIVRCWMPRGSRVPGTLP